ncbi:hypothetical protein [Bosea sp. (in: a-proteobacteria)]|uniref:hypothetical protein n=1 Tax=Bosea sp. (in: a-proteobacteria) TaxID=1871050 RepID=UPI002FC59428
MSGDIITAIREWLLAAMSRLRRPAPAGDAGPGPRKKHLDPVALLIDCADAVEAGFSALARAVRRHARSGAFGLTRGLIWRGAAAATGIGLTATLVAGLSSGEPEAALPSLSTMTPVEAPAIRDVRVQAAPSAFGQDGWINVTRPIALFGLETPELGRRTGYEARRNQQGSQREDMLSFGEFGDGKPFLALKFRVNREGEGQGAPAGLSQPFVIALVRESAARGLSVGRSGAATPIETKFGLVETADIGLGDGTVNRACIGFRHLDGAAHLSFSGWWCGGEAKAPDRAQLTCMLDRIDLLSAGDDQELRAIFARTELNRRQGCSVPRLAASGRKGSWLDADGKAPALKTASGKPGNPR